MAGYFFFAVFFVALSCPSARAQEASVYDGRLAGSPVYSDPGFQDYIETSDGYLNPKNAVRPRDNFRDAYTPSGTPSPGKTSPAPLAPKNAAGRKNLPPLPMDYYKVTFADDTGPIASFVKPLGGESVSYREYVFVGILPKDKNYGGLLQELAASSGFKFSGERTVYSKNAGKTLLLGWVQAARLDAIYGNPAVAGLSVEKKSSGVPIKARVRFTLKIPYQNRPGVFVGRFIKTLGEDKGFVSENVFRLPASDGASKFTAFDVTGVIPIDMVVELAGSPFVASVETM